jgi:hypothetical protein
LERFETSGRITKLEDEIPSFHVAVLAQAFPKSVEERIGLLFRGKPCDAAQAPFARALPAATLQLRRAPATRVGEASSWEKV